MPDERHPIPPALGKMPLDVVVRTLFAVSWGKARGWIEQGKVRVDGEVTTDLRRKVQAGSEVLLQMSAPRPRADALDRERIVYLDSHVVVVNKPAGVSTIPYDESETGTLDELVREALGRRERIKGVRPALGVVHRLDKETSGLIVFTRTWLAKKTLSQQFRDHATRRRYLAIAHGDVHTGTLRSHIVQNRGDGMRGSIEQFRGKKPPLSHGQEAITHVEALEKLGRPTPGVGGTGQTATLIACRLETGRTHQIRIHLSEDGHPILGDRVYVRGFNQEIEPAPRLMLHATELGFVHPATNLEVRWEVPPPRDFEETLTRLRS